MLRDLNLRKYQFLSCKLGCLNGDFVKDLKIKYNYHIYAHVAYPQRAREPAKQVTVLPPKWHKYQSMA
ncbi:MAG: hypothetical protein ACI83O_000366 [Patescibacteria group bacterium]|jgi:hypothetical protein